MIEHATMLDILTVAQRAISPYNNQPWRFRLEGDSIQIYLLRTKNFFLKLRGVTPMSLGFLLENLRRGAAHHGYAVHFELSGNPPGLDAPYARVNFTPESGLAGSGIDDVAQRRTNRFDYQSAPLSAQTEQSLKHMCEARSGGMVSIQVLLRAQKDALGNVLSDLEQVRLSNSLMLMESLDYVQTESPLVNRLSLSSLGYPVRYQRMVRALKRWPALVPLACRWLAQDWVWRTVSQRFTAGTAGYVAFKVEHASDEAYVQAGQQIQGLLNGLQSQGLASQSLLSGLYLLHLCFETPEIFSNRQKAILLTCSSDVEFLLGGYERQVVFVCRVGVPTTQPVPLTPRVPITDLLV